MILFHITKYFLYTLIPVQRVSQGHDEQSQEIAQGVMRGFPQLWVVYYWSIDTMSSFNINPVHPHCSVLHHTVIELLWIEIYHEINYMNLFFHKQWIEPDIKMNLADKKIFKIINWMYRKEYIDSPNVCVWWIYQLRGERGGLSFFANFWNEKIWIV